MQQDLITQWTPKIYKMLQRYPVYGHEYEDLVQELKMVILRCDKKFDAGRGASFHTYLHRALLNKILQLRNRQHKIIPIYTPAETEDNTENKDTLLNQIKDTKIPDEELLILLTGVAMNTGETLLLDLLLCGLNIKDVKKIALNPEEISIIHRGLRNKFLWLRTDL